MLYQCYIYMYIYKPIMNSYDFKLDFIHKTIRRTTTPRIINQQQYLK